MTQPAEHALFDRWTGRHASTLQAALRMSQDEMAAKLGVSKRSNDGFAMPVNSVSESERKARPPQTPE